MKDISSLLKNTKLLRDVPIELIKDIIIPTGSYKNYEKRSYLIRAGQRENNFQIILSGKVNIVYYFANGDYNLASTESFPNVLALDLIATKSRVSPYFAVATEPTSVFSFPVDVILQSGMLPEAVRQTVLNQILIMLSHMHMQKEKHRIILSRKSLRERIMIYLSLQAQLRKSPDFTIPLSREELAAYLCVNRSTLSHELSLMRSEGIIDFRKNKFSLLQYDPEISPV